jgi:hypothetical protein
MMAGGTGNVSFAISDCVLSKGGCSVTLKGLSAGGVVLVASYGGDVDNSAGSSFIGLTIRPAKTSLSVSCTSNVVRLGESLLCTATVKGSYGPVEGETITWSPSAGTGNAAPSSQSCALSSDGSCSITLTGVGIGRSTIIAKYVGDANNDVCSRSLQFSIT